jgi:ribosomal protein L37AE/L43A
MTPDVQERRQRDRRGHSRGGRRVTDTAAYAHSQPSCPSCKAEEMANEASEADGGWWFVCGHCDHLWNERERLVGDRPAAHAEAHRPANLLLKLKNIFRGVTPVDTPGRSNPTT